MRIFTSFLVCLLISACGGALPIIGGSGEAPPIGVNEVRITCYNGAGTLAGIGVGSAQGSFDGVRVVKGNDPNPKIKYTCNDGQEVNIE